MWVWMSKQLYRRVCVCVWCQPLQYLKQNAREILRAECLRVLSLQLLLLLLLQRAGTCNHSTVADVKLLPTNVRSRLRS